MPKEITVSFKLDEDMEAWFSKTVFDIDKTKSQVIRCALLLSLDTISSNPSLVHRILFEDRKCQ